MRGKTAKTLRGLAKYIVPVDAENQIMVDKRTIKHWTDPDGNVFQVNTGTYVWPKTSLRGLYRAMKKEWGRIKSEGTISAISALYENKA